jgi:class 3 adenylate cyclase
MADDARRTDEALMKRLAEAICDVSGSPTSSEGHLDTANEEQLAGVVRMLKKAPSRSGGPPPQSDNYQR